MKPDSKSDPRRNHERAPLHRESIFDRKLQQWRNTGDFARPTRTLVSRITGEHMQPTVERRIQESVGTEITEIEKTAFIDPITNGYNERSLKLSLKEEISRAKRYKQNLGVLLVEMDRLRDLENSNSSLAIETALKSSATVMAKTMREVDILGRFDDGRFLILAPETSMHQLSILADRIRNALATSRIAYFGERLPLTFSAGLSAYPETGGDEDAVLEAARRALKLAVDSGGDASAWAEPALKEEGDHHFVSNRRPQEYSSR